MLGEYSKCLEQSLSHIPIYRQIIIDICLNIDTSKATWNYTESCLYGKRNFNCLVSLYFSTLVARNLTRDYKSSRKELFLASSPVQERSLTLLQFRFYGMDKATDKRIGYVLYVHGHT